MITAKESDVEHRRQEMMDSLPPYYQESPEANAIMRGNAWEIERKRAEAQDLLNQFFVSTATWGLDYWDRVLDLSPQPRMNIQARRGRILAKLSGTSTATKKHIENIVNGFLVNRTTKVIERNPEYFFDVEIDANEPIDFIGISKELDKMKPAHLDYSFRQKTKSNVFFATTMLTGEEVSVYPWSPSNIEVKGYVTIGSYIYDYDTTNVYPQEGV